MAGDLALAYVGQSQAEQLGSERSARLPARCVCQQMDLLGGVERGLALPRRRRQMPGEIELDGEGRPGRADDPHGIGAERGGSYGRARQRPVMSRPAMASEPPSRTRRGPPDGLGGADRREDPSESGACRERLRERVPCWGSVDRRRLRGSGMVRSGRARRACAAQDANAARDGI